MTKLVNAIVSFVLEMLPIDSIVRVSNHRSIEEEKDVMGLAQSILQYGLRDPIVVYRHEDGTNETMQGHCRLNAIKLAYQLDKARAEELFGEGIPCHVCTDLTDQQYDDLKTDDVNSKGVNSHISIQLLAARKFNNGRTEKEVAFDLKETLDKMYKLSNANREKLQALTAKAEKANEDNDPVAAYKAHEEYMKEYGDIRRGKIQGMKAIWACPNVVTATLHFHERGYLPLKGEEYYVGDKITMPSKLSIKEIKKLAKLHAEDENNAIEAGTTVNKMQPGPLFIEEWKNLCERVDEDKPTKPKSMSANDIVEKERNFLSKTVKLTCRMCAGKGPQEGHVEADKLAYMAEVIAEHDPETYELMQESFTAWIEEQGKLNEASSSDEAEVTEEANVEG